MRNNRTGTFILAGLVGFVAVLGLTLLIYATFFQDFLERYQELTPDEVKLISRKSPGIVALVIANLGHGFFIATVLQWGKFYTPLRGAAAAAVVAFLTEIYFLFTQYAAFRTMTLTTAILDTAMWTFINLFVGASVAWVLARSARTGEDTQAHRVVREHP